MQRKRMMFTLLLLMGGSAAHAANVRDLRAYDLGFAPMDQLPAKLGLGADYTFKAGASIGTARGTQVVRMQQYYKGVPVYGYSLAVERIAAGGAVKADGRLLEGLEVDLASMTPRLDEKGALSAWFGSAPAAVPQRRNGHAMLLVYPDHAGRARLAYLVSYDVDQPMPARPVAVVDGHTGEIIEQWDGMAPDRASATGRHDEPASRLPRAIIPGDARRAISQGKGYISLARGLGGNLKTGKYHYGTQYPPLAVTQDKNICTLKNAHVETYGLQSSNRYGLVSFTCPSTRNDGINGAFSPADDAHHFAGVVVDMYRSWFGDPPVKLPVQIKVNSNKDGHSAYWDGEAVHIGDGDDRLYPPAALDVIAHGISHGFTESHTNLYFERDGELVPVPVESSGFAAGVEEAFSDMAGEAAEFFARGSNDFLFGADVVKSAGGAMRYLCDPTQDGRSIDNLKDYSSSLAPDQVAGIFDKAFCLLARTEGWDTRKAFEAFYDANKVQWTPLDSAEQAACAVERAAADRGYSKADVTAALADVGVSCEAGVELQDEVQLAGLSGVARSVKNYRFQLPAGASELRISAYGGQGNADLYVKFGARPTATDWDCRPELVNNNEVCVFSGKPPAGTYYVQLRGAEAYSCLHLRAYWNR